MIVIIISVVKINQKLGSSEGCIRCPQEYFPAKSKRFAAKP
jgi:hypothetical protein